MFPFEVEALRKFAGTLRVPQEGVVVEEIAQRLFRILDGLGFDAFANRHEVVVGQ